MAKITKIMIPVSKYWDMGPAATQADEQAYSAWLLSELRRDFEGADIALLADENTRLRVETDADDLDADEIAAETIAEYAGKAWGRYLDLRNNPVSA